MARKQNNDLFLMSWSKRIPIVGGQDPLGLNLRVSTRLSRELLFGLTSVTKRARYYSFLPWCVLLIQKYQGAKLTRDELISQIERFMVIGCILKHENNVCEGGALVGSKEAKRWLSVNGGNLKKIDKVSFADIPAWRIYRASLLDLGLFDVSEEAYKSQQEEVDGEELEEKLDILSWNDIQLSNLGISVAQSYAKSIGNLKVTKCLLATPKQVVPKNLKEWGKRACLCNLKDNHVDELSWLRNVFFNKVVSPNKTDCHNYRRDSLLCVLEIVKKTTHLNLSVFDSFKHITYFGHVIYLQDKIKKIEISPKLDSIGIRWKMFYFHYYLSVALEIIFIQLITECQKTGVIGFEWKKLLSQMDSRSVKDEVGGFLNISLTKNIGSYSFSEFLGLFGIECSKIIDGERHIDELLPINHDLSEYWLDFIPNDAIFKKASGMAVAIIYLLVCLVRYCRWDETDYGIWLTGECLKTNLPNKNVSIPVILKSLSDEYDKWWLVPIRSLSNHIISRYIVNLHSMLAYDKSFTGNNSLFRRDGERLFWNNIEYDKVSAGNPRLSSAVTVLSDLGYLSNQKDSKDIYRLTKDGDAFVAESLKGGK